MIGLDAKLFGILISGGLTLMAYSFLYRENRAYRIAEHIYLGAGVGYGTILSAKYVYDNAWTPLVKGNTVWAIPLFASILLYFYFSKKHFWIYRIPTAAIIGVGTGIVVAADFRTRFTEQIRATLVPLFVSNDPYRSFNNIVIVLGVVGSLLFFYFSREHRGLVKGIVTFGKYIIMITFGAAFGQTFMARISLIIGRIQSLYLWPAWILLPLSVIAMGAAIGWDKLRQKKPEPTTKK